MHGELRLMETLKLQVNKPAMIALAFAKGKPVQSALTGETDIMFSTVDGHRIFLPPSAAEQIYEAGIPARKPFQIIKRGPQTYEILSHNGSYPVAASSRDAAAGTAASTAASTAATISSPHHTNGNGHGNPPADPKPETATPEVRRLMAALGAAIDAVAEAQDYAKRRGLGMTFSEESVRCLAITVYITISKEGR
jgi:hypothetical protein